MSNSVDDFEDLGTEARLAVRLAKAGAVDSALGFLVRRVRNDFGSCREGLDIVIGELRGQVPQCFHEEPADPLKTAKAVEAMPNPNATLMSDLADAFRRRSEAKQAMRKAF